MMTITYINGNDIDAITFVSYIEFGADGFAYITTAGGDEHKVSIEDLQEVQQ